LQKTEGNSRELIMIRK